MWKLQEKKTVSLSRPKFYIRIHIQCIWIHNTGFNKSGRTFINYNCLVPLKKQLVSGDKINLFSPANKQQKIYSQVILFPQCLGQLPHSLAQSVILFTQCLGQLPHSLAQDLPDIFKILVFHMAVVKIWCLVNNWWN